MFKKIKFLFKDDRGQSLIMVALMMIILLGVTALTVDYGFLAWQRRSLQNAADAGALAAAWELPDGDVVEKAKIYVDQQEKLVKNSLDKAIKINNERAVQVDVKMNYSRFFGRIFGDEDYIVDATATAEKYLIGSLDLLPLADIDVYKDPEIKDKDRNEENNPDHYEKINMDLDKYYEFMKTRINKTLILREKHGQISGNFGLLDLTEFSVGKNIKEVLDYRLNSKVYNKEDKTGFDIPVEPGKIDSIEKSNAKHLSTRLEKDGWRGYVLAILPRKAMDVKGSSVDIFWGEYLLIYLENMEVDVNNDDAPITGTIKGVFNIYGGDFPNMIDDIDDERVRIIK